MYYVFINPVVDYSHDKKILEDFLTSNNCVRVYVNEDWVGVTKQKYKHLLKDTEKTVIDMRCPIASNIFTHKENCNTLLFPSIEPILIHCARELSERKDLQNAKKIITSPCNALAKLGNSLGLKDTVFYTWKDFLQFLGQDLKTHKKLSTPIPLGFFNEIPVKQISLSGHQQINTFAKSNKIHNFRLIEMLYCKDGCHNGDGVA